MTKYILLIALSVISSKGNSQTIDSSFYEYGNYKKNITIMDDTLTKIEIFYENGQNMGCITFPSGPVLLFYVNGIVKLQGEYKNNLKHGEWIEKYSNGNIKSKEYYLYGKKHSQTNFKYFNQDGQLIESRGYYEDKEDGFYTRYDTKGKLIESGTYRDGKKDSYWQEVSDSTIYKFFYKDGVLKDFSIK